MYVHLVVYFQSAGNEASTRGDDQEVEMRGVDPNEVILQQDTSSQYPLQNMLVEDHVGGSDQTLISNQASRLSRNYDGYSEEQEMYNQYDQRGITQGPEVSDVNSMSFIQNYPNSYSSYDQVRNQQPILVLENVTDADTASGQ